MPKFRLLPILMALGVTFNHFHCIGTSLEAAAVERHEVQRAMIDGASRDFGPIQSCENETGCICRGAIFIAAPAADLADLSVCQWCGEAQPAAIAAPAPLESCVSRAALERRHFVWPISSRALRAWLGSLLI